MTDHAVTPQSEPDGSDICCCGDFRSEHRPKCFCGCLEFNFIGVANDADKEVWQKYHKNVLKMPSPTFAAMSFEVKWETAVFRIAGTLDGFIDLAVPQGGTYPLNLSEAEHLAVALRDAITDVKNNCLYEHDSLLKEGL